MANKLYNTVRNTNTSVGSFGAGKSALEQAQAMRAARNSSPASPATTTPSNSNASIVSFDSGIKGTREYAQRNSDAFQKQYQLASKAGVDKNQFLRDYSNGIRWLDQANEAGTGIRQYDSGIAGTREYASSHADEFQAQWQMAKQAGLTKDDFYREYGRGQRWTSELKFNTPNSADTQNPASASANSPVTLSESGIDQTTMEKIRAAIADNRVGEAISSKRLERLQKKYGDKVFGDNFAGQFGANFGLGRIQEEMNQAWSDYLDNPTEENKNYALALSELLVQFQTNNAAALDDQGVQAEWLSKTIAGYLPQLWKQTKASAIPAAALAVPGAISGAATGGAVGTVAGTIVPGLGNLVGGTGGAVLGGISGGISTGKWGAVIGNGIYSFNAMRGASFYNLTQNYGIDETTAKNAANNEAAISSVIEMGDTAIDVLMFIPGVGAIKEKITKELGKTALRTITTAFAKYGLNIGQEYGEEYVQELISIANERLVASGAEIKSLGDGGLEQLAQETAKLVAEMFGGEAQDERARAREAGKGGAIIGAVMGGVGEAVGTVNSYVASNNLKVGLQRVVELNEKEGGLSDVSDIDIQRLINASEDWHTQTGSGSKETAQKANTILKEEQLKRQINDRVLANTDTAGILVAPPQNATATQLQELDRSWKDRLDTLTAEELQADDITVRGLIKLMRESQRLGSENGKSIARDEFFRRANEEKPVSAEPGREENHQAQPLGYEQGTPAEAAPAVIAEQAQEASQPTPADAVTIAAEKERLQKEYQAAVVAGDREKAQVLYRQINSLPSVSEVENPEDYSYTRSSPMTEADLIEEESENAEQGFRVDEENAGERPPEQTGQRADTAGAAKETQDRRTDSDVGRGAQESERGIQDESSDAEKRTERIRGSGRSKLLEDVDRHYRLRLDVGDRISGSKARKALEHRHHFNILALREAGFSVKDAEKTINALLEAEKDFFTYYYGLDVEVDEGKLTEAQKNYMLDVLATNQFFSFVASEENDDTRRALDILIDGLGIDENEAQNIIDSLRNAIPIVARHEGIIDESGMPRTSNKLVQQSQRKASQSGKNNKLVESGKEIGKADTVVHNERFVKQDSDVPIRLKKSSQYRLYLRGENNYVLVDKDGYVAGEFEELGHALIAANKSAKTYLAARIPLFGDVFEQHRDRLTLNQEVAFSKQYAKAKIRSMASDTMDISYDTFRAAKSTTKYIEVDLRGKSDVLSSTVAANRAMLNFDRLVRGEQHGDNTFEPGLFTDNGKKYVFFGQTANQAKKGIVILVDSDVYDKLRAVGIAGLSEDQLGDINPVKYMANVGTIFTPSNDDTGLKVKDAIVMKDIYSFQHNVLRRFMRVNDAKDFEELLKYVGKEEAERLVSENKVGTMFNYAADILLNITDGTGFVLGDRSFQMRSAGGFKGLLASLDWVSWLTDNIPVGETVYRWYDDKGEPAGGIRHLSKEKGVEILDKWDTWQPIKGKKALLFDSTVKFGDKYSGSDDFYAKAGDYDIRSIPRENVYGARPGESMVDNAVDKGLAQFLRNQSGFSKAEASRIGDDVTSIIREILGDKKKQAKLFGVDFDSPVPPALGDVKAALIYKYGEGFLDTALGQKWVANKLGQIVNKAKGGKLYFKNGSATYQWVAPDLVSLTNKMTAIAFQSDEQKSLGIGRQIKADKSVSFKGSKGLGSNEILNMKLGAGKNTLVGRYPSAKESDVQVRQNVSAKARKDIYNAIVHTYGLDPEITYLSANDILSLNLDNDYDGDTVVALQGALADILYSHKKSLPESQLPVDFAHALASKEDVRKADVLLGAIRAGLDAENIGRFDMAIDLLDSYSDAELAKTAANYGKEMTGTPMSPQEFRELLQAQFGVAYVLSIDFAKTGYYPPEFKSVVDRSIDMLDRIAEENGYFVDLDEKTGKKKTNTKAKLTPAWYENAKSAKKRNQFREALRYQQATNKKLITGDTGATNALDMLRKHGKLPEETYNRENGKVSWGNTFFADGPKRKQFDLMEISPIPASSLAGVPDSLIENARDIYDNIMRDMALSDAPYSEKTKDAHEKIYTQIQQKYGLNNYELTALLLYSLNLDNHRENFDTFFSLDQQSVDPSNTEPSTADILSRNARALGAKSAAERSVSFAKEKLAKIVELSEEAWSNYWEYSEHAEMAVDGIRDAAIRRATNVVNSLKAQAEALSGTLSKEDFVLFNNALSELHSQIAAAEERLKNVEGTSRGKYEAKAREKFSELFERIEEFREATRDYGLALEDLESQVSVSEQNARAATESYMRAAKFGYSFDADIDNVKPTTPAWAENDNDTPAPNDSLAPESAAPTYSASASEEPENLEKVRADRWKAAQERFGETHGMVTAAVKRLIEFKDGYFNRNAEPNFSGDKGDAWNRLGKGVSSLAQAAIGLNDGKISTEEFKKIYDSLRDTSYWNEQSSLLLEQAAAIENDEEGADYKKDVSKLVSDAIDSARAQIDRAERMAEVNNALTREAKSMKPRKLSKYVALQLNAPTFFKMLSQFKQDTQGYNMGQRIIDSVRRKAKVISDGNAFLTPLSKMQGYKDLVKGRTKMTLTSLDNTIISALEATYMIRALASVEYWSSEGMLNVRGFTIGNKIIKADDIGKVYFELQEYFKNDAPEVVKAYNQAVGEMFNSIGRQAKAVSERVDGFFPEFFAENWYAPIRWSKNVYGDDIQINYNPEEESLFSDPKYMNMRNKNRKGYLLIEPMSVVSDRYIKQMADYVGFKELRADLMAMNNNSEYRSSKTIAEIAGENLGQNAADFVNDWIKDMTVRKKKPNNFFYKARTAFQKGVLIGSPSVMMKQTSSLWSAMGMISPGSLVKARLHGLIQRGKAKGSPMYDARAASWQIDYNISELLENNNTFFDKLAQKSMVFNIFKNGIGMMDRFTINSLYLASCYEVEKRGIPRSDPEFANAVDDLFSNTVALTQPMFDTALRPDIARSDNELLKMLSMFRTQQGQNFNNMVTAIGEYKASGHSAEAKQKLQRTISGQVAAAISLSILSICADLLLHSLNKYRDKDGELDEEKILNRLGLNFIEAAAGTAWLGDQAAKYIVSKIDGYSNEFNGLNLGPISTVDSLRKSIDSFLEKPSVSNAKYCAQYISQLLGVPINNVYRLLNSAFMYAYGDSIQKGNDYQYDDLIRLFENQNSRRNRLTDAILSGDSAKANELIQSLDAKPETYSTTKVLEAKTIVRQQVDELLEKGEITRDQAVQILQDYGAYDEEEADKAAYGFQFENEFGIQDVSGAAAKHYYEEVQKLGVSAADWVKMNKQYNDFGSDKDEEGNVILSKQRKVVEYINGLGYSAEDRYALYDVWYDKTVNVCKTEVEYLYSSGKINATQAKQLLQKYAEMDTEKAQDFITKLDYAKRYPDLIDIDLPTMVSRVDWIERYATIASPAGISTTQYAAFTEVFRTTSTTYGPDGKTQVSKQEKMTAYINSLPLSSAQKDAMWKACGYSTTSKAWKNRPWK